MPAGGPSRNILHSRVWCKGASDAHCASFCDYAHVPPPDNDVVWRGVAEACVGRRGEAERGEERRAGKHKEEAVDPNDASSLDGESAAVLRLILSHVE